MRSTITITMTILLSAFLAGGAQAVNVAGWDFSGFARDGVAGGTVDANYSSFDPTGNAGAESATYGTATLTNVSSRGGDVSPSIRTDVALGEQQNANLDGAADGVISNSFNAFTRLKLEGQADAYPMAITAPASSGTAVFEGDLTTLAGTAGYGWSVSFAGQVVGGSSATVNVEFAPDCSSYSSAGTVSLDEEANEFTVAFDKIAATNVCARLTIPHATDERAVIDNVSLDVIAVPEPAWGAQLMAGFVGLVALCRRRA